jgi:hypothetical protein
VAPSLLGTPPSLIAEVTSPTVAASISSFGWDLQRDAWSSVFPKEDDPVYAITDFTMLVTLALDINHEGTRSHPET